MVLCTVLRCLSYISLVLILVASLVWYQVVVPFELDSTHTPIDSSSGEFCNFDRTVCCTTNQVLFPATVQEVQDVVRANANNKRTNTHRVVRVVGAGHSMSEIVCDRGASSLLTLVSLDAMQRILSVDRRGSDAFHAFVPRGVTPDDEVSAVVTVEAGIRLVTLNRALWHLGLGLRNMGVIQEQSLAGLLSTGTHGTGPSLGSVSAGIAAMDLVLANGTLLTINATHNADLLPMAKVSLGLLGVMVRVSLFVRNRFYLHRVQRYTPLAEVLSNLDAKLRGSRNYQVWLIPGADFVQEQFFDEPEWPVVPGAPPGELGGACSPSSLPTGVDGLTNFHRHKAMLMHDVSVAMATFVAQYIPQLSPFLLSLIAHSDPEHSLCGKSFDMLTFPGGNYHAVRYSEMEYFMPLSAANEAAKVFSDFFANHLEECPLMALSPIRTVRGDNIALSPNRDRDSVVVSFVMLREAGEEAWRRCAGLMEAQLQRLGDARPHWGKHRPLTVSRVDIEARFGEEAVSQFVELRRALDPTNLFLTEALRAMFE